MRSAPIVLVAALSLAGASCGSSKLPPRPQPFPQPASAAPEPAAKAPLPAKPTVEPAVALAPAAATPAEPPALARAAHLIEAARAQLGVKYVYGGDTPSSGFDCSGFVRWVFEAVHIELPRTVPDQFGRGVKIPIQDVRAGDLIFFTTTGPGATHVGIALGDGTFIHAPTSNGVVRIEHYDTPYWHDRIVGARRVIQATFN